jgi:hypothetical protein
MAKKSLEERVAALEAKVGDKSIEERFREQAELIDRLFAYRFAELDRNWDAKLESKFDEKLAPIQTDLAAVKDAVQLILTRLPQRP